VVIVGYASPEGEQHHNSDLAISRADAVKKALINNGVKASRLSVKNGGATSDLNPDLEGNRTVRFE
jgi:outer membrane protein OmpA-like peptidoglycan-associated protein